ncbi:Histamine H2 receptor [Trichoplax sp. H2]|nr:Histamine H2 receptor [Trichoplax sp. H2]|eukprot:RDD36244.1 Histamine H2 receptor [Trichoplax sp. H2]
MKNTMLTGLAFADLCTGSIVPPCMILTLIYQLEDTTCQVQGFVVTYFHGVSLVMSAAISIDRCSAISDPYTYLAHLQVWRYSIIVTSIWIIPLPFAITPLLPFQSLGFGSYELTSLCWLRLSTNKYNYVALAALAAGICSVVTIIICCYVIIFCIAYRKKNSHIDSYGSIRKSIRTAFLIVGSNVFCWLPLGVTCSVSVIKYFVFQGEIRINSQLESAVLLLPYSNVAINPLIYAGTNEILKERYAKFGVRIYNYVSNRLPLTASNAISDAA